MMILVFLRSEWIKKAKLDNLSKIINPDVGVITNISYAHAKNFKNIKQIALAKAEIINNIKNGGSISFECG